MRILCKADGLCEPAFEGGPQNPKGVATYGYLICYEDGRFIAKDSGVIGEGEGIDHMVAEYEAVVKGLSYLIGNGKAAAPVEVQNDNAQLFHEMKTRKEILGEFHSSRNAEARRLTSLFSDIRYKLIIRELNWEADCLAWKEYRRYLSER